MIENLLDNKERGEWMIASWKMFGRWNKWSVETKIIDPILIYATIFYLVLPILIFAFGWMKPVYAGAFSLLVLWGSIQSLRHFEYRKITINNQKIYFALIVFVILAVWLLLSGIGGYGLQSGDFDARNAIFRDLINHNWPVRYDYSDQPLVQSNFGQTGVMVYYFLFWLPAALLGKFFGWQIANLLLYAWSLLGLLLIIYLILRKIGKTNIWVVVAFIFFSGMDIIFARSVNAGSSVFQAAYLPEFLKSILAAIWSTDAIEWWANLYFQYSSITTLLYNVFNQAIPAWIVTLLILNETQHKNHIFIYSLLFLFAPLPFVGLFPFILQKSISPGLNFKIWFQKKNGERQGNWIELITLCKQNLSFQNLIVAGMIMIIAITFFYSNTGAVARDFGFIWEFIPQTGNLILMYVLFCLVEFLILGLCLYKNCRDKPTLIFTLVLLLIIPMIKYGSWNEFAMRVSIPSLMILFVLMVDNLFLKSSKTLTSSNFIFKSLLVLVLLLGSITPLHEIHRSIDAIIAAQGSPAPQDTLISFDNGENLIKTIGLSNFVINDSGNLPFFKYFSK